MRVLVVSSYPPRRCGIGRYARDQVARLRAEGDDVTVLSPPDGDGDLRAAFPGGRAFRLAARRGGRFDRVIVHFQPALYYRPRAILSKVSTSLSLLWMALRLRNLDLLVHEADPPVRWRPDYALLGLAFRAAARVSFHTEAERRSLEHAYRVRVRGAVVPHRATPVAPASRREARRRLGIDDGRRVFVCPGFLQPSKGFHRAVEAFRVAANGGSLYVVGSVRDRTAENVAYAEDLRRRCEATPGATMVERFLPDDEFDLWVAAADWVVLPYRTSWSSGVLARAHALGTPGIVAAVGGLPEQAGRDDVVFGTDDGLMRAMRSAGGDPRHRKLHEHSGTLADWDPEFQPPPVETGRRGMLFALIIGSVLLAAVAQLTLKHGMTQITDHGRVPLDLGDPVGTARRVITNVSVVGGLAIFVLSAAVWLVVLSRVSLSFAYPFASLTYVMILVFDRFVLDEPVSVLRWGGVALIIAGLVLVSRTHQA